MGLLEDVFNVVNGVRSGIQDVPAFVGDVATGNVHGMATDGRKLIGDVGDVLKSAEGLGVSLGKVPERYLGTVGKLADSPILTAAQLAIEAQKATTGSGAPEEGNGYRDSAVHLAGAVETLVDAKPHDDRWDGTAAIEYTKKNHDHRVNTSNVQAADEKLGAILAVEAGQVSRTRKTLDTAAQDLYDYGLATAWMNYIPPLAAAKVAGDTAAAAAALATTDATMAVLVKNSLENAMRIRGWIDEYTEAAKDTSGDQTGCAGAFVPPIDDRGGLPTRLTPGKDYSVPEPEEPPQWGPPAAPYGQTAPAPSPTQGGAP